MLESFFPDYSPKNIMDRDYWLRKKGYGDMTENDSLLFLYYSSKLFKELQDQQLAAKQDAEKSANQRAKYASMVRNNRRR